ncbi:MFS transporter [Robbsia sp. KACC 23696]|uniref:MFS transporter n=1 Tax=Robbsia sp. KACC 23696 TaxID=3149231 RepID=UPI00325A94D6
MRTVSTAESPPQDGLQGAILHMASASIFIAMVCANLDMAIVQNALPALTHDMAISSSDSVSIVTIYMLVTLTLLLPFAPLSDRIGYRRFFLGGFLLFTLASLGCGLSRTLWELQLTRLLQGVGSAAMMCTTTSLIRIVYPKARIARAIGANSTVVAVSLASAPSLSAAILLHLSWHWLFWINVPLGVIAMGFGLRSLPHSDGQMPAPFTPAARTQWQRTFLSIDWAAVVLNIAFFTLLLFGTDAVVQRPAEAAAMLAVAALLGYLFVRRQIHVAEPMLPFDLLRERRYAFTIATSFGSFAAQGAAFVSLPFYLQRGVGFDAVHTALIMTAWPLALACSSQVASRLTARVPIAYLCAIGQGMMTIGLGLVAARVLPASLPCLMALLALSGAGFGFFQSPNNYVIVASAPPGRSGSVGALRAATRVSGQLIGSALCGLALLLGRLLDAPASTAQSVLPLTATHAAGMHAISAGGDSAGALLGIWIATGMALLAGLCSLSRAQR